MKKIFYFLLIMALIHSCNSQSKEKSDVKKIEFDQVRKIHPWDYWIMKGKLLKDSNRISSHQFFFHDTDVVVSVNEGKDSFFFYRITQTGVFTPKAEEWPDDWQGMPEKDFQFLATFLKDSSQTR